MNPATLRRVLHAASAGVLVFSSLLSWPVFRWVVVGFALLWLTAEFARTRIAKLGRAWQRAVPVYRAGESHSISGAGWLWIGYAVTVWFPPSAATAGIVVAALADPAASAVGSWVSARERKSLAGTLAFAVVALGLLAWLRETWVVAGAAATAGAVVERWPLRLNDNFLIAPTVAAVITVLA